MRRLLLQSACFVLTLAGGLSSARADVVFTTLPAGATTYTNPSTFSGNNIYNHPPGTPTSTYFALADQFTPTSSYTLTSISLALGTLSSPNGTTYGDLTVSIFANNPATNLPLNQTPLVTGTVVAPAYAATEPLTTFNYTGAQFTFVANQSYWLGLAPARDGSDVNWGNGSGTGRVAQSSDGSTYTLNTTGGNQVQGLSAFRIEGDSTVPEPSTWAFAAAGGLAALIAAAKRRTRRC